MANPDDVIDPNDLDSIDALLDEAELDADSDLDDIDSELESAEIPEESPVEPEQPAEEEPEAADEVDQAPKPVAETEELPAEPSPAEEESGLDVAEAAAVGAAAAGAASLKDANPNPPQTDIKSPDNSEDSQDEDSKEKLPKHVMKNKKANSKLTVAEMDSLKKLIIIFGASSIVLILTAIGIGVWSALAASNAGMTEETQNLIEATKVASDQNTGITNDLKNDLSEVEKKLDAVNFQIEQLAGDLLKMQGGVMPDASQLVSDQGEKPVIDPVRIEQKVMPKDVTAAVAQADPKMIKKIDSINYRLIKTQRAVDEVKKQLKSMQRQQQNVLHSVKGVEKYQLLEEKRRIEAAEKAAEEKKRQVEQQKQNQYRYQTPDGMFYDEGVTDSYP